MCKISDRAKPSSGGDSSSQGSPSGDFNERFAYINSANRKVRLIDVLRHYGHRIERNPHNPSWSISITCPLISHKGSKERTPSFGYNFVKDRFFCLGCGLSGRAVEFISSVEGVTRTSVADKILAQYGEDVEAKSFEEYEDKVSPILLDGSKFLQVFIQKHKNNPNALKHVDKLIWWLDFYMAKASGKENGINAEELKYRLDRVKEFLSDEMLDSW